MYTPPATIRSAKRQKIKISNVIPVGTPGQPVSQYPQLPCTCVSCASTRTEHHGIVLEASTFVHSLYLTPLYLNGNTHGLFEKDPEIVLHVVALTIEVTICFM